MTPIVKALHKSQEILSARSPVVTHKVAPASALQRRPSALPVSPSGLASGFWFTIIVIAVCAGASVYFWPQIQASLPLRKPAPAEMVAALPEKPSELPPSQPEAVPVAETPAVDAKEASPALKSELGSVSVIAIMTGDKPRVLTKHGTVMIGEAITPNLTLTGIEANTLFATDKDGLVYRRDF